MHWTKRKEQDTTVAMPPLTVPGLQAMKNKEKITMLTAYDTPTAHVLDQAGIDVILVGDSLGNVVMGLPNTLSVTLENMIHHASCVVRGTQHALVVADMPFGTYQASPEQAVANASKLIAKSGAQAVKVEGGAPIIDAVSKLVSIGIPVMGHVGLTPQSVHRMGGYKVQGKTEEDAKAIVEDALALEHAGAFAVVLECIPEALARNITDKLTIPTIGIGSGNATDGQVLVFHDLVGFTQNRIPSFVHPVANVFEDLTRHVKTFMARTKEG